MSSVEEITQFLKDGYAAVSGQGERNVEIYNVEETTPGTFLYDASVYFRQGDQGGQSTTFHAEVADAAVFQERLKNKIKEKHPVAAANLSVKVDTDSGRYTRSFNKGRSRPNFDRIVPVIQLPGGSVDGPDFLEIRDVSVTKTATGVNTSFAINTNLVNHKILWRIKLATADLSVEADLVEFLKLSNNPSQKQSYFTSSSAAKVIDNKTISQAYTAIDTTHGLVSNTFDASADHFVYVVAYFEKHPTFVTVFQSGPVAGLLQ
eukprot:1195289-Prorocentrum_minimum.AAC.6